jgi:hypothetical protein
MATLAQLKQYMLTYYNMSLPQNLLAIPALNPGKADELSEIETASEPLPKSPSRRKREPKPQKEEPPAA